MYKLQLLGSFGNQFEDLQIQKEALVDPRSPSVGLVDSVCRAAVMLSFKALSVQNLLACFLAVILVRSSTSLSDSNGSSTGEVLGVACTKYFGWRVSRWTANGDSSAVGRWPL